MKMEFEATLKRTEARPGASPWHTRKIAVPVVGVVAATAVILGLTASTVILLLSPSRGTNTGPQAPPSAVFLKSDKTTQGNWRGKYGFAGFALANDSKNIPPYARIVYPSKGTASATGTSTWADATGDVRALQKVTAGSRIAGHWYGFSPFSIDIDLRDEKTHQVSLYLVDWDSNVRVENIEVVDAVSKKILDLQQVSKFDGGQYLVW